MKTTSVLPIDPTLSVNDIIRRYPAALALLTARGIDTCCEGGLSLGTAAADASLDLSTLLREIADAVASDRETRR